MATRLEEIATAVHAALNDATIARRSDRKALHENDQLRRIVWITEGGTTEPPKQAGGRVPGDGTAFRIVACKIRIEHVDAHIYGETREAAERMLDNLIAAVCLTVPTVAMPTYRWQTEEQNQEGHQVATAKAVLRMHVRLPVPDQIRPLEELVGSDTECGIDLDDGSFEHEDGTVDPPPP